MVLANGRLQPLLGIGEILAGIKKPFHRPGMGKGQALPVLVVPCDPANAEEFLALDRNDNITNAQGPVEVQELFGRFTNGGWVLGALLADQFLEPSPCFGIGQAIELAHIAELEPPHGNITVLPHFMPKALPCPAMGCTDAPIPVGRTKEESKSCGETVDIQIRFSSQSQQPPRIAVSGILVQGRLLHLDQIEALPIRGMIIIDFSWIEHVIILVHPTPVGQGAKLLLQILLQSLVGLIGKIIGESG